MSAMRKYLQHGWGGETVSAGGWTVGTGTAAFFPIEVEQPQRVKSFWLFTGGTPSGTAEMGLYTEDGRRLVTTGAVSLSLTFRQVLFTLGTPYDLARGVYYLAIVGSAAGGGILYAYTGNAAADYLIWGAFKQASASPLPATATFATNTTQWLPLCGFNITP